MTALKPSRLFVIVGCLAVLLFVGCSRDKTPSESAKTSDEKYPTSPRAIVPSVAPPSEARKYYSELYNAGGLDHWSDEFACFRDDDVPTFILLARGETLKQGLIVTGIFETLSAKEKAEMSKDYVSKVSYHKGISSGRELLDHDLKDGSYVEKVTSGGTTMTIRLRVNWRTLRYKLDVEYGGLSHYEDSGKCEPVKPDIQQRGGDEFK